MLDVSKVLPARMHRMATPRASNNSAPRQRSLESALYEDGGVEGVGGGGRRLRGGDAVEREVGPGQRPHILEDRPGTKCTF